MELEKISILIFGEKDVSNNSNETNLSAKFIRSNRLENIFKSLCECFNNRCKRFSLQMLQCHC